MDNIRSRARVIFGAASLVVAMATVLAPAAAATVLSNGATASTYVSCDPSHNTVSITLDIRPESRFSSQSVAVRFYTKPWGGVWSDPAPWVTYRAPVQQSFSFRPGNIDPMLFTIYAEYAWFDGTRWTYSGELINTYTLSTSYGNLSYPYCQV